MTIKTSQIARVLLRAMLLFGLVSTVAAQNTVIDIPSPEEMAESVKAFEEEMKDDPRYQHEKKGYQLLKQGKAGDAIVEFDAALKLDPETKTVHVKKGIALNQLQQYAKALEHLDKGIALHQGSAGWTWWPQYYRGVALISLGRLEEAIQAFSVTIEINKSPQAYTGRAMAHANLNRPRKALDDIGQALKYSPGNLRLLQTADYLKEQISLQDFWLKMAKSPGARTTPSGLIFLQRVAGSGPGPAATDTVKVHYHGTLVDGTVFDSSVDRGQAISFPLNRVIKCWTEGLQMMKVGGKSTLVCPAQIAYGARAVGDKIKAGATLVFDVELLAIE